LYQHNNVDSIAECKESLIGALKVLINITNENNVSSEQIASLDGLSVILGLLVCTEQSDKADIYPLLVGLLINLTEQNEKNRQELGQLGIQCSFVNSQST
jgi:hypothetical protein